MTAIREWTQYEDKILKFIRDQEGIQKWSTIAQKMTQQYGIKGRNGKQCKQRYEKINDRYMEVFDQNNQVLHWDYQTEQQMFSLHDKLGNKWAAIGQQLKNRTDNDVKNHFYSKIRKGLRKINYTIKDNLKKQSKQIKQTVLYKIIEGTEDKFSPNPVHEQDVWLFCQEVKNCLLRMSYDEDEYNAWNNFEKHAEQIKDFVENLAFFSKEFKRKPKNVKRNDQQQIQKNNKSESNYSFQANSKIGLIQPSNLRGSNTYQSDLQSSELEQSQSEEISRKRNAHHLQRTFHHFLPIHNDTSSGLKKIEKINQVIILKSSNEINQMLQEKSSMEILKTDEDKQSFSINFKQNLLPTIPKLIHISSKTSNAMIDEDDEDNCQLKSQNSLHNNIESQLIRQGLLQQDDDKYNPEIPLFNGNNSRNITSKGSNFSSYSIDEQEEVHFFQEDSTLNMRIYTTGVGGKRTNELQQSIQKSDKLFKSLERGEKLFQSIGSRGRRQIQMSIQKSQELKHSNSLFQSVGR